MPNSAQSFIGPPPVDPVRLLETNSRLLAARLEELERRAAALEAENRDLKTRLEATSSETDFRQVIDASPVPLSVDDMKGTIEYVNRKFVEKFGYALKDVPTSAKLFERAYPNPEYRRLVAEQWKGFLKR